MSIDSVNVLAELRRVANPTNVAGMGRFGIAGQDLLGISAVKLRAIAKRTGRNHSLAKKLWTSRILEALILAAFVAEPAQLTRRQANAWAKDFECWADCDGLCIQLFLKTPFARELAVAWSGPRQRSRNVFWSFSMFRPHQRSEEAEMPTHAAAGFRLAFGVIMAHFCA
jgi:3-methyladenine DNA glycosylase AlkD